MLQKSLTTTINETNVAKYLGHCNQDSGVKMKKDNKRVEKKGLQL